MDAILAGYDRQSEDCSPRASSARRATQPNGDGVITRTRLPRLQSERPTLHDPHGTHKGHAAQIDHLIIHRYGMAIVESKSISGRVQTTPHGE
ncbi:MAG: NERD domain-containing protein [Phycisphaerales bacterium]|nr:NERD domain-containing protein [Phycisphaerales bacterium]